MRRRTSSTLSAIAALSLISMCGVSVSASAEEPLDAVPLETIAEKISVAAKTGASREQISEAASLPLDGAGSLGFDENSRVNATVFFDETPSDAMLAELANYAAVDQVFTKYLAAEIRVSPELMTELSELPGISSVAPTLEPTVGGALSTQTMAELRQALPAAGALQSIAPDSPASYCGPIPIEADAPLRADAARTAYSVDGSGVTIGIISDSFNKTIEPASMIEDVSNGALPGDGNPCGRDTPVELLSDERDNGEDEGRAMAQLVHGIAPGAKLLFADAGFSELGMAMNIERLAEAGADIIVDDISWSSESYYQKGIISAAIEEVKREKGVAYFTSVGNATAASTSGPNEGLPHNSWQTNAYRQMTCPDWVTVNVMNGTVVERVPAASVGMDCMDFDPGDSAEQAYDTLVTRQSQIATEFPVNIYGAVGEAMFGVTSKFQIQFYQERDPAQDPAYVNEIGMVGSHYSTLSGKVNLPLDAKVRMVIVRVVHDSSVKAPALNVQFTRGGDGITERQFMGDGAHDWVGEGSYGHSADGSAISVGSMEWQNPTVLRDYSSLGPGTLLYEMVSGPTPAPRLAAPQIVNIPHIVSVDGTQTTFFGEESEEGDQTVYRFDGTSAAAPNAAAVAALALSYRPELSGAELTEHVIGTARTEIDGVPLGNPYSPRFANEHVFGAGLIDALGLLNAIDEEHPAPTPAAPTGLKVTEQKVDSFAVAWDAPHAADLSRAASNNAPVERYLIVLYKGDAVPGNEIETEQLTGPSLPTSHRFTGLTANTQYSVKLIALAKGDSVGASQTIAAKTLAKDDGGSTGPDGTTPVAKEKLSNTGSENLAPWIGIAGAMLLLAAACVLARRRIAAGESQGGSN